MQTITVRSAVTNQVVTGRELKRYEQGLTVEDPNGVVHYVTYDRVFGDTVGRGPLEPVKPVENGRSRRGRPPKVEGVAQKPAVAVPASNSVRTSKYVPKHGVCPVTGRALNANGAVRALRGSKKVK